MSIGHADYFPNGGATQPGCETELLGCSHLKAYRYYQESITTPLAFLSKRCYNFDHYKESNFFNSKKILS